MSDPRTAQEWQDAVDAAAGSLALASAKDYGFVVGGPTVNLARCDEIIARGAELGYTPADDAVERFTAALLSQQVQS